MKLLFSSNLRLAFASFMVLIGTSASIASTAQAYEVIGATECKIEAKSAHQATEIHFASADYSTVLYYVASFEAKACFHSGAQGGRLGHVKQTITGSYDTQQEEYDWSRIGANEWNLAKKDALARCEFLRQNFLEIHSDVKHTPCGKTAKNYLIDFKSITKR